MEPRIAISFSNIRNWDYPFTLELTDFPNINPEDIILRKKDKETRRTFGDTSKRMMGIYRALWSVQQVLIEPKRSHRWPVGLAKDQTEPFAIALELAREGTLIRYDASIAPPRDWRESLEVRVGYDRYREELVLGNPYRERTLIDLIVKHRDPDGNAFPNDLISAAQCVRMFFLEFMRSTAMSSYSGGLLSVCYDPELAQEDGYLTIRGVDFFLEDFPNHT